MTNAQLAKAIKKRWEANGVKPESTKARLIEFEFLQGYHSASKHDGAPALSPYVQICMMSGRTIVTADLLKEAEAEAEVAKDGD